MTTRTLLTSVILVCTAACRGESSPTVGGTRYNTISTFETVVSTNSGLVGYALDLATGPNERLFIADARGRQLLSVGFDGSDPQAIGREGSGPGEFLQPTNVFATSDSLLAYDGRHQRVMVFDLDGVFSHAYVVEVESGRGRAFGSTGQFLISTNGRHDALMVTVDVEGQPAARIGLPVVPPPTFFDMVGMKERASAGEVPQESLNDVLPAMAPDGSFFVSFFSQAEVRRYAPDGALIWTTPLNEPEFGQAFDAFVQTNATDSIPYRFHSLSYFSDSEVVGGDLWLLVNTSSGSGTNGLILVLDGESGAVKRRLSLEGFPGVRSFTYSPEAKLLFLALPEDAMILSALMPEDS